MGKRDFDFKDFMLRKGEKIGLYSAGGIAAVLMAYSLFWGSNGFRSGSPGANERDLNDKSVAAQSKINTNRPGDNFPEAVVPPHLLLVRGREPKNPDEFRLSQLAFQPVVLGDPRRVEPTVFQPDALALATPQLQLRFYIFNSEHTKVAALGTAATPTNKKDRNNKNAGKNFGMAGKQGSGNAPFGSQRPPGMPGGSGMPGGGMSGGGSNMPYGGGRGPGMPGMGGGMPGMGGGMPGMGGGMPGMGGAGGQIGQYTLSNLEKEKLITYIEFDKLDTFTGQLAEEVKPLHAVEIAGTVPLKKQIDEFVRALRLRSPGDLFNSQKPEFRFRRVNIERRTLLPNGKPLTDWQPQDLKDAYTWMRINNGGRFESEDKSLQAIVPWSQGLLMPRPEQFQPGSYPKLETELPTMKETLATLEKVGREKVKRPPSQFEKGEGNKDDPFGGDTGGNEGAPGSDAPGGMPGKAGGQKSGGDTAGTPGGEGSFQGKAGEIPDHALLRVLDVRVEPGFTYEYRVQVVMANPNFQKKNDVAYPELAEKEDLLSAWTVVPQKATITDDVQYYAIDLKHVNDDDVPDFPGRDRQEDKETARRFRGATPTNKNATALHVQRWLDSVNVNPNGKTANFATAGDWVIAERLLVFRGEYVGQTTPVKVPIWSATQEDFVLAANPAQRRDKEIPVPFGPGSGDAVLVDFDGGPVTYRRTVPPAEEDGQPTFVDVKDKSPTEALIMTIDGRLIVRDGAKDIVDKEARERHYRWLNRIKEIEQKKQPNKPGAPGDPFGGGSPPGGSGT